MKKLALLMCLTSFILFGCGLDETNKSQTPVMSDDSSIVTTIEKSELNSYIVYSCKDYSDTEINKIMEIIKKRALLISSNYYDVSELKYNLLADYDKKEIRFEFDNINNWSDIFADISMFPNLIEFKKGDSVSAETNIDNSNIVSTDKIFDEISGNWSVLIRFNETGKLLFADLTEELSGTNQPLSIWIDNEMIYAPLVSCKISDGQTVITGNFSEKEAEKLTERLCLEYLPYDISIKETNISKND